MRDENRHERSPHGGLRKSHACERETTSPLCPCGPAVILRAMPTLFRLVFVLAVIAGLGYGGLIALAYLVEPRTRDMSFTIPQERLNRDQPPR